MAIPMLMGRGLWCKQLYTQLPSGARTSGMFSSLQKVIFGECLEKPVGSDYSNKIRSKRIHF